MKLGLVLECDAGGPDELVFKCVAQRLAPGTEVKPITVGKKKGIFERGVETARDLIDVDECDLVLIVWDLKPLWEDENVAAKSCKDEVAELRKGLAALEPETQKKIRLLCLTWELETWLIADERAVRAYLSTETHQAKFKAKSPQSKSDPKSVLNSACKSARGERCGYIGYREAIRIAQLWEDTSQVGTIDSFKRFAKLLTGNASATFQRNGDICADLVYQAGRMGRT